MICTSITRALMAFCAMFPTVLKTYETRYIRFSLKRSSQKTFLIPKFVIDWTSCRTIQGAIVLVISNRSRASCSFDFEITRAITP